MTTQTHTGRCGCGAVTYEITDIPLVVHACHCRMCQRLSGSIFAVNALIEASKVKLLSGNTHDQVLPTPSGLGQVVTRCQKCQSAVWSEYKSFNTRFDVHIKFIRAGSLDQPELFAPDVNIFTASKQPHATLKDNAACHEAFYDVKTVWSEASLKRLRAARRPVQDAPQNTIGTG